MIRRGSDSPIRRSTYIAYACPLAGLAGKSNQEPAQLKGLDKFTHTMAAPFAQDFGDLIWPKRDARAREASSAWDEQPPWRKPSGARVRDRILLSGSGPDRRMRPRTDAMTASGRLP